MQAEEMLHSLVQVPRDSELEIVISRALIDFGIPPHARGYQYIREALLMLVEDGNNLLCITKDIYPEIARKFYSSPSRVERAIRHAVEISWDGRGRYDPKSYFPENSVRPANSEFLDFVCNLVYITVANN
ncbi:MAG: sporulation initiation factor Spo0A C-terminal domain-containing protein [Oscillospiraceae bacterium]|nr:sporulation initiation factor Spo0A C-terminal domain-containing protein [Oscillospiraceae bacterium]